MSDHKSVPYSRRIADFPTVQNCRHDWALTFRDGPTDTNDWQCQSCGEIRNTRGDPKYSRP